MAINSRKGYTLAEMMMAVAILGILAMVGAPLLINMTNFWSQTTARNNIQRDVRVSLDTINRFARQARSSTVVIDRAANQPPSSRITFDIICSTCTSVQSAATLSFYQSGNKLYMSRAGELSMLSSNVAYITFSFPRSDDISILSVALTTQAKTYKGGIKALQLSIQKVRIMN